MRLRIFLLFLLFIVSLSSFANKNVRINITLNCDNENKNDTSISGPGIKVTLFDLKILPPSSGVQFYKNGIVFLSSSKYEKRMVSNHISFWKTDALYGILKDSVIDSKKFFSPLTSFPYPCDAVSFNRDYSIMYFTKYSEPDGVEKIYKASYSPGTDSTGVWNIEENPVNFCTGKYHYTHPALSADGKLMIFASDRPGSVGGMDLFASQDKGGTWSDPVNLGEGVNSTSNEMFPFLDRDNNLFFSSDGEQGYGGYDIYVCRFKSDTWEKPINLGTPVNSESNDIAFTIDRKEGKTAFYTVEQKNNILSPQLFKITFEDKNPDVFLTLSQYFTKPDASKMVILVLEPAVQATDKKSVTAESISRSQEGKEVVTYRVQFMTSFNPRTRTQISVAGKEYNVFDYLYSGAYRLCVGEFSTLAPALELQDLLRKNDYPQANVLAFKNNIISFDPELLKQPAIPEATALRETPKISEPAKINPEKADGTLKEKTVPETIKTDVTKSAAITESKKSDIVTEPVPGTPVKKDVVVYRIQFLTNTTPKGVFKLTISGKTYNTFEYLYAGAYRSTVGEFSTLSSAAEFQKAVRQSGYPQAFVVAFKNNVRSTDPALFK
jgi:hypothetical protein